MSNIALRASALSAFSNTASVKTITIPAPTVTGDLILVGVATGTSGHPTTPSGWTLVAGSTQTNGVCTDVYYRVAQAGDSGSTVTFGQSTQTRAIISVGVYSGVDTTSPIAQVQAASETVAGTSHAAGTITTTAATWVVRFMFGKDGATASTAFTEAANQLMRQSQPGNGFSGTNQISLAMSDSNGDRPAGSQSGTWSLDSSTANAVGIGIALNPVTTTVTVRPVADVTTTGTTIVGGASAFTVLADDDPATYVEVPAGTFTVETRLGTLSAAPSSITVKFYGAGSPASMQVVTSLYQGTTLIGQLGNETALVTSETTKTYSLTGPQQAACTNLADLRVRQVVTVA